MTQKAVLGISPLVSLRSSAGRGPTTSVGLSEDSPQGQQHPGGPRTLGTAYVLNASTLIKWANCLARLSERTQGGGGSECP